VLRESKLESQILCEKSRVQDERQVSHDQAEIPEEQERHTQLEIDDKKPDDDSAALVYPLFRPLILILLMKWTSNAF